MYALWPLLLVLCLLVFFWRPKRDFGSFCLGALAALAVCSHPAAIMLFPFLMVRAFCSAALVRLFWFALSSLLVAYVFLGVETSGHGTLRFDELLAEGWRSYSERMVFESIFGTTIRMNLIWNETHIAMWIIAIGLTSLILSQAVRVWKVLPLLAVAFLFLVFGNLTRGTSIEMSYGHRYSVVSSWLFLVALFLAGSRILAATTVRYRAQPIAVALFTLWVVIASALQSVFYLLPEDIAFESKQLASVLREISATSAPYCYEIERGAWTFVLSDIETCARSAGLANK